MPLRVTDEGDNAIVSKKKIHRKMSRNGHYQKVRRPTGLEVYTDAARILEELLEKRIDDDVKVGNTARRNKSDPTRDVIRLPREGDDATKAVARSKTMPSRYRESKDEELKKKDLDHLREKAEQGRVERQAHGSESSMDTADEDTNEVGAKRQKKSRFKRAVERLKHVFNRDQKEGLGKVSSKDSSEHKSPSGIRKKPKRKQAGSVVSETSRHVSAHHEGEVDEVTQELDYKDKYGHKHTTVTTYKDRHHKKPKGSITVSTESDGHHRQISGSGIKFPGVDRLEGGGHVSSSKRNDIPQPTAGQTRPDSLVHGQGSSKSSSPSPNQDLTTILAKLKEVDADGADGTPTSSNNSSGHGLGSPNMRSSKSNVLDSPGEEIEYMDSVADNNGGKAAASRPGSSTDQASGGAVKYHSSKGLLDMTWLADQMGNGARMQDLELDEKSVTSRRPDGGLEVTTTIEARRTTVLDDVLEEEVDGAMAAADDGPKTEAEKEEMYSKVAQRLVEMADSYANLLNTGDEGSAAVASIQPVPLSDLENEIISCLRSGGDRNSRQFDAAVAEATDMTKEEAYERFRSTVQNSLGRELSWDYLAFLFYTTKGVVSAVGKGSQVASQAKEFTLQYISDTFATWLIDQGGFDSMLSETEETDFELD